MLEDIRLHIHPDDETQTEIEQVEGRKIPQRFARNKRVFLRHAPGLRNVLDKSAWQNYGVFFNKYGEANLVEQVTGTALYGRHPGDEVGRQVKTFCDNPLSVSLSVSGGGKQASCLVVLGLGLGKHLSQLIQQTSYEFIIIYEPDLQFFLGSCSLFEWEEPLQLAEKKGITLFFQIGESGKKIKKDLSELRAHCSIDNVDFFLHYNTPEFLSIYDHARYYKNHQFFEYSIEWQRGQTWSQYLPVWTPPTQFMYSPSLSEKSRERFSYNIELLQALFPELAGAYSDYIPKRWQPVESDDGELTLQHKETGLLFSGERPKEAGAAHYRNFVKYPNKDGLILDYNGTKLLPYLHYQFVKEVGEILSEVEDEKAELPESLKSVIMFGIGSGYQLLELVENHHIEALLVCEPEPDFFYAALHAIDFSQILKKFKNKETRLYFNIGDDGSHLFSDLMHQFHAIGPYVLQDTYFYQGYTRKDFADAIASLREQLQVVVSAGEYFDHARYGIEHTRRVLKEGCYLQKRQEDIHYPDEFENTPVFIIGNGPSLDKEIDYIKSVQNKVLIVSCGTTIKTLAKHGIKPDIHCEIEQNRSTYDWLVRADCEELLADTILYSCNGIHPDVVELFKEVWIGLKKGESSTEIAELALGKDTFEKLEHAYPTVTNLALNACVKLGFTSIHLFGTDLAFLSDTQHHSKESGYYDDNGNELYAYAEKNQIGVMVKGNFGGYLKTKYEFKLSKNCLELLLRESDISCFNSSHGALIEGATPLSTKNVNLNQVDLKKEEIHEVIRSCAFLPSIDALNAKRKRDILDKFDLDIVKDDVQRFISLAEEVASQKITIDQFVKHQRKAIVDCYHNPNSMSFYLFYGTCNFVLSVFSKISTLGAESSKAIRVASAWLRFLNQVSSEYIPFSLACDGVNSLAHLREKIYKTKITNPCNVGVVCDTPLPNHIRDLITYFKTGGMQFDFSINQKNTYTSLVLVITSQTKISNIVTLLASVSVNNLLLVDTSITMFEMLKAKFSFPKINLLLCPYTLTSEKELQNAIKGNIPFCFHASTVNLIPKIINTPTNHSIFLPRLKYSVDAKRETIDEQIGQIIETLGPVAPFFYVFVNYCCFNADRGSCFIDDMGNRAEVSSVTYSAHRLTMTNKLTKAKFAPYIEGMESGELKWTI
jgi:hypothetical protein